VIKRTDKIEKKIKRFERAFIPDKESLILPKIEKILLALDAHDWVLESSRYAYRVTCELATSHGAVVEIICMAVNNEEYPDSEKLVEEAVKYFEENSVEAVGSCAVGSPSENILELIGDDHHDLLVLPSPYAERVEKGSQDSIGATIDILITRLEEPLLLLPESKIDPVNITQSILLPVIEKEDAPSIEWALIFSGKDTTLEVLDIVREEHVESFKDVSSDLLDEEVEDRLIHISLREDKVPLIKALRELTSDMDLEINVTEKVGETPEILIDKLEKTTLLILRKGLAQAKGSKMVKETKKNGIPLLII